MKQFVVEDTLVRVGHKCSSHALQEPCTALRRRRLSVIANGRFTASPSEFLLSPFSYACSRVERQSVAARVRSLSLFLYCCLGFVAMPLFCCWSPRHGLEFGLHPALQTIHRVRRGRKGPTLKTW